MHIELITPPAVNPVLLAEFKDHLRIDGNDEDASLGAILSTAVEMLETKLDLALISRTATVYIDAWQCAQSPSKNDWWQGVAEGHVGVLSAPALYTQLPIKPVSQIHEIAVQNQQGDWVIWPSENYIVKPGLDGGVSRRCGKAWPQPGNSKSGIRFNMTYGFGGSWNDVPASLRQAVLMLASYLYANKGNEIAEDAFVASGVRSLISSYVRKRI